MENGGCICYSEPLAATEEDRPVSMRTLKYLRWFSLGMLAVVSGLVAYFFFRGARETGKQPRETVMRQNVTSTTREIEYIESKDGRPLFRVRAERNVATREGLNELERVQATYYGKAGDREDSIAADRCFYAVTENWVHFQGHVRLRTAQGYNLETSDLRYEKASESAAGDGPFKLSAPGLTGEGRSFRLDLRRRELSIPGRITLHYDLGASQDADPAVLRERFLDLQAGSARIAERDHRVRLEGGVSLRTGLSRLDGQSAELRLTDKREVRSALCQGGARYARAEKDVRIELAGESIEFFLRPGERTTLEEVRAEDSAGLTTGDGTLTARTIRIIALPEGSVDRVLATGGARFQAAGVDRGIDGDDLTLRFTQPLALQQLEVEGSAVLRQNIDKGRSELGAASIRIQFRSAAGKVAPDQMTAGGDAFFAFTGNAGDTMRCQADTLRARMDAGGRFPTRTEGEGKCVLRYQRPARQERIDASGQRFGVDFFPQTTDASKFRMEGGVNARRTVGDRWSETASDFLSGEFSAADHRQLSSLVQQGDVRFRDATRSGRAKETRLEGDLLRLIGKPVVESEGVVIRAAEMTYEQRTGNLRCTGGVETVANPANAAGPKPIVPLGSGEAAGQTVYIHARTVELDQAANRVTFSGGCRMTQGRNVLTAARFVWNRQDESFTAEDKVLLTATVKAQKGPERRLEVQSGRMAYNPARRRILFEQKVRTTSADGEMTSDSLWGYFEEGAGLRKLFARDRIRITQQAREATGDRAMVDLAANQFVLQGSPARVVDRAEGRTTQGVQLTFFQGDDRIRVDSEAQVLDMD